MYDPDDYSVCACTRCGIECLALDEASALCSACAYDDYEALTPGDNEGAFTVVTDTCCECGRSVENVPLYAAGSSVCHACDAAAEAEHAASHRSAYRAGLLGADWPHPTGDDHRARAEALAAYDASCVEVACRECGDVVPLPPDAYPVCAACAALLVPLPR